MHGGKEISDDDAKDDNNRSDNDAKYGNVHGRKERNDNDVK